MTPPILGYARVSGPGQVLDRQEDELRAAGADQVYSEVGSGKKGGKRPEWDQLLRSLRKGDTLMVTELSRLGRSTSQLAALLDNLEARGVTLNVLNLGDTSTPSGRLVFRMVAAVAEMERDLLIERTHSGLAAARSRGRKGGRRRTFSAEQEKKAQKLYSERNLTVAEIAKCLGVSRATVYRYVNGEQTV